METAITGSDGLHLGTSANDRVGLYNATPIAQPSGSAQAALTDSTGGTAGATLAAGVGRTTVVLPLTSLATGLSTSAMDLLTTYVPGYAFKLLKLDFVTTVAGTGTSASQAFNLSVGGTTPTTGGVCTVTLASTATVGAVTAGTAITAANTGTATDSISLKMAAGGTVFTAGAGYFLVELQNLDTANAVASIAALDGAIRTALINLGAIKGGA